MKFLLFSSFRKLLNIFAAAYNSKVLSVPLEWLQKIFIYPDEAELEKDLLYVNLLMDDDRRVKFEKAKFDISKTGVRYV